MEIGKSFYFNEEGCINLLSNDDVDISYSDFFIWRWGISNNYFNLIKNLLDSKKINPGCCRGSIVRLLSNKNFDINILKLLLDNKYDINIDSGLPLIIAASNGRIDAVEILLEQNNIQIHYKEYGAVRFAAQNGYLDIVKILHKKGANIHAAKDYCLRKAASNGHLDIVKYLVEQGADISVNNYEAFQYACLHGEIKVMKYLVEVGANINCNPKLVRLALRRNQIESVGYLLSKGFVVKNSSDFDNLTEASFIAYKVLLEKLLNIVPKIPDEEIHEKINRYWDIVSTIKKRSILLKIYTILNEL
jgi:hypothetical protein